jgi:hypothetical protein
MLLGLTTAGGNGQSGSKCGAAPVVGALLEAPAVRTPPPRTLTSDSPLGFRRAAATSAVRIEVILAGLVVQADAMSAFLSRRERQPAS